MPKKPAPKKKTPAKKVVAKKPLPKKAAPKKAPPKAVAKPAVKPASAPAVQKHGPLHLPSRPEPAYAALHKRDWAHTPPPRKIVK